MGAEQLCPHKLNVLKCSLTAPFVRSGTTPSPNLRRTAISCQFIALPRLTENQNFTGFAERYFLTISAILKTIAWSNSRRSRPVSFFIFSSL